MEEFDPKRLVPEINPTPELAPTISALADVLTKARSNLNKTVRQIEEELSKILKRRVPRSTIVGWENRDVARLPKEEDWYAVALVYKIPIEKIRKARDSVLVARQKDGTITQLIREPIIKPKRGYEGFGLGNSGGSHTKKHRKS